MILIEVQMLGLYKVCTDKVEYVWEEEKKKSVFKLRVDEGKVSIPQENEKSSTILTYSQASGSTETISASGLRCFTP